MGGFMANSISGTSESAIDTTLVAANEVFDGLGWPCGNLDPTLLNNICEPLPTGLVPDANGFIDTNGFASVDMQVACPGFTEIAESTTVATPAINNYGFCDPSDFGTALGSGFTGADGYTGVDGFAGTDGFTGFDVGLPTYCLADADLTTFNDASLAMEYDTPNGGATETPTRPSINDEILDVHVSPNVAFGSHMI